MELDIFDILIFHLRKRILYMFCRPKSFQTPNNLDRLIFDMELIKHPGYQFLFYLYLLSLFKSLNIYLLQWIQRKDFDSLHNQVYIIYKLSNYMMNIIMIPDCLCNVLLKDVIFYCHHIPSKIILSEFYILVRKFLRANIFIIHPKNSIYYTEHIG